MEWKRELIIFIEPLDFEIHLFACFEEDVTSVCRISVSMNADAIDCVIDFRVAKTR